MRLLGVLAVVQALCASVVPPVISRILAHKSPLGITKLDGLKEELQTLARRHVTDNWRIQRTEGRTWGRGSLTSAYHVLNQMSGITKPDTSTLLSHQLQQDFLKLLTVRVNNSSPGIETVHPRMKREDRGVMYLPVRDVWTKPPAAGENLIYASHSRDSHHFIRGSIGSIDGCFPRKTYARVALATLRALQDILHSPVVLVTFRIYNLSRVAKYNTSGIRVSVANAHKYRDEPHPGIRHANLEDRDDL
ncbi:hypothetical protein E2C01_010007 [Portunus trituberculatus]|uniref:Uncharacterized protein n=1 Tax=Portunus trituberculatus TaxID=210409 RepID=A0A5B7D797_PORTR|nr:hypothetical protein [Portunus trituberculatus]